MSKTNLTKDRLAKRQKLKDDFIYYADNCLKIRTKAGKVEDFVLNKAQLYIHERIEEQLANTGKVRALILKGRQQGVSTYTEGRYYWKTSHRRGVRAFILTHEQQATDNLFDMVQRYHEHCLPAVKPSTDAASAKELSFGRLDSGYKVGTAGSKGVGRSSTIQYFHGSEVAFWPNAETHAVGIMQAIPDQDDTESILESTANGLGNFFHVQWKAAEAGKGDYIAIFVPWFWQDEYRKNLPKGFTLTAEETDLKKLYKIDNKQIFWRRNKIVELSAGGVNGETQFKQEYPMNAAEAFQMSGVDTLITPEMVMRARTTRVENTGHKIMGVDPSLGVDRFTLVMRQGRKIYKHEGYVGDDVNTLQKRAAKCIKMLDEEKPDACFIDAGFGADLVDYLKELGYEGIRAINFGSTPRREDKYVNKRAEMIGTFAEWLNDENVPVEIPDDDEFHADICACPYTTDAHNRILIKKKTLIRKEFGFSPDYLDASALTFAAPVSKKSKNKSIKKYPQLSIA